MKKLILVIIMASGLGLVASCGDSNNSTATNAAVAPDACGTTIPAQYCTDYNVSGYGYSNLTYGTYGYGYYGNGGFAGFGCPMGYQPLDLGSYAPGTQQYTCVMNSYFSGYGLGYHPYYAHSQRYSERGGYGAAQACAVAESRCSSGQCLAFGSGNVGYCAR